MIKKNYLFIDSYKEDYSDGFRNKGKVNVIIIDKELFVREFRFESGKKAENFIKDEIKIVFDPSKFLFHYEICNEKKSKKLILYGVNANEKVRGIWGKYKINSVVPIQILVARKVKKVTKKMDFLVTYCFKNTLYLINVENGVIRYNKLYKVRNLDNDLLKEELNNNLKDYSKQFFVVKGNNEEMPFEINDFSHKILIREDIYVP